ncbi:hypothetical protein L1887_10616 [Cichorium endivia]|nr:hypothetical protein L1887_10616 [Cichorium endivia]
MITVRRFGNRSLLEFSPSKNTTGNPQGTRQPIRKASHNSQLTTNVLRRLVHSFGRRQVPFLSLESVRRALLEI